MLKSLLESPLSASKKVRGLLEAALAAILPHSQRILTSPTVSSTGNRLCVFAHYDPLQSVDPHVFYHLRALQTLGCDILFVSTCRNLRESDRKELLTICHKVILRKNLGYDFGSYRAGLLEMADAYDYEQIILVNDSVFGPFHDLKPIFEEIARRELDIWSITDSYEFEYHLQSYFLVFSRKAWRHPLIKHFWSGFWHVKDKRAAIHLYEIGLSRLAKKAHLQLGAWCDTAKISAAVLKKAGEQLSAPLGEIEKRRLTQLLDSSLGKHFNISHIYWDYLIRDYRCPYLKVELVRDNPIRIPNITFYPDLLGNSYPHEFISKYLRQNRR